MPSKFPRAGRVVADLLRDDDAPHPGLDRFWERRPSAPGVTRLSSRAASFDDGQFVSFAEGTLPPGTVRRASTREPTADLE